MKFLGTKLSRSLSTLLVLFSVAVVNQNTLAQTSEKSICLYSQANYQGEEFCATTNIGFVPLRFETASIKLGRGYEATLYRLPFFTGSSTTQIKSNPSFTELSGDVRSLELNESVKPSIEIAAVLVPVISLLLEGEIDPNDYDGDGFSNDVEDEYGTNPRDPNSTPPDIDGDKIPDDIDDDRDGDGFDNDVEVDNDTDPNNPRDYPDLVKPILEVNNETGLNTTDEQIIVTGRVLDPLQPRSGLAEFYIQSDAFTGTKFTGSRNEQTGEFSIEVPLKLEVNKLEVVARDKVGNESRVGLIITRGIKPLIIAIEPADGTVTTIDSITVFGQVKTNLPTDQFVLSINGSQVVTTSTEQADIYSFNFADVPLEIGENVFEFKLVSDFGGDTQVVTINYLPGASETIPPPTISGITPSNGATLSQASFRVGAQVRSFAGPLSVLVNGQEVLSKSQGLSNFPVNELVSFADNQGQVTTTISASDSLGKTTNISVNHFRDASAPSITLDQNFNVAPQVNQVDTSKVLISGTISDDNLRSVLVNNQSVELTPGSASNTYRFEVNVAVLGDADVPVSILVHDRSGNKNQIDYLFKNTASASIASMLPPDGTNYLSRGEPLLIQVAARLSGQKETDQAFVYLESTGGDTAQAMTIVDALSSGSLQLPSESAEHVIVYELRDQSGARITQDKIDVSVKTADEVEFEVLRVEPENNQKLVEPNEPIEIYFNQTVDLSKLKVTVRETLHGKSYVNQDPLGEDFINSKGYSLVDINRDLEIVQGQVNTVPRGSGVVFAPDRLWGYNADIFVEVTYEQKQLSRTRFKVRELPTFINGALTDQFGQPLRDIVVSLPELGRTTKTNGDGGFVFGYQESGDKVIPQGSYRLLVNDGFANPSFGSIDTVINVQRNRVNNLKRRALQELDKSVPFYTLKSGSNNILAGGDLEIDLTDARAIFANSRTSGPVHAQFLPFEHMGVTTYQFAIPHWLFGLQPKGITVEGDAELRFKIPKLRGTYDYIDPENYQYVVLLGYSAAGQVVEPIGVGKIENLSVVSVGKVHLASLDYLGYAVLPPSLADTFENYSEGRISLQQLKATLQALKLP